ncbi:hypothetical protein BDZ45DRAFT_802198 [Acephala macrosclerotiorum]|nr:hypothetical protein BDZ45DRAFT_802198 [Acephala macrosclerotiorum]
MKFSASDTSKSHDLLHSSNLTHLQSSPNSPNSPIPNHFPKLSFSLPIKMASRPSAVSRYIAIAEKPRSQLGDAVGWLVSTLQNFTPPRTSDIQTAVFDGQSCSEIACLHQLSTIWLCLTSLYTRIAPSDLRSWNHYRRPLTWNFRSPRPSHSPAQSSPKPATTAPSDHANPSAGTACFHVFVGIKHQSAKRPRQSPHAKPNFARKDW